MQQTATNSSDSPVNNRTAPNKTAIPPRSTFELLIDAAGAVSGGPENMAPTRARLPPLRLAARPTNVAPSPTLVYGAQRLPPLQTALHPLAHPNSLLPRPNSTSPPPPPAHSQLGIHPPNVTVKPETVLQHRQVVPMSSSSVTPAPKKACPILPRGSAAVPAASNIALVPTPHPCHTPPVTVPSPASSTASLAAVAAVANVTLSDVEKRQMIRKVRNREAAARSNLRRKEKHLALKHELIEVHEQAQRLRKVQESLKEENEQLRHLLGRAEKCNQVSSVLKSRCPEIDELP